MGLQEIQRATLVDKRLKWVTWGCIGLHGDRVGYIGLHGVTKGYKGLQEVTRCYKVLQGVT